MSLYRKKPVVIEARQFTSHGYWTGGQLAEWCGGRHYTDEPLGVRGKEVIEIDTLEGMHRAVLGDWIIRGVQGEFYPCKPDIFAATYEPAHVGCPGDGERPVTVPPEAITAANHASELWAAKTMMGTGEIGYWQARLHAALEAAAPLIAAAERDRIIKLAEQHNVRVDMGPLSDPPTVPFADLLRGDQP